MKEKKRKEKKRKEKKRKEKKRKEKKRKEKTVEDWRNTNGGRGWNETDEGIGGERKVERTDY